MTVGTGSNTLALPEPPGQLGRAATAVELIEFLEQLLHWVERSRGELDRLDELATQSPSGATHTRDVVLAMALWQALRTRTDAVMAQWDSGRADAVARERISELIWGRLGAGALDVTLPEGARLVDALIGQLREALAIDPATSDLLARLRRVRAELVRCEDLVDNAAEAAVVGLVRGLTDRHQRLQLEAERGADITGRLAELEENVARTHRDLLVGASKSGELRRDREHAQELRDTLASRRPALLQLAARCKKEIANPPRFAIPDAARLGEPPHDRPGVDSYLDRLDAASRAMAAAESAYAAPLRARASLRYRLAQAQAQAEAFGRTSSATVRAGGIEALSAVDAVPCDVELAGALVAQYEYLAAPLLPPQQRGVSVPEVTS
ncbi:MAG: hypothetical protein ACK5KU_00375 [Beutenbergiaceae bacterium]